MPASFTSLPWELREYIWKLSLPPPRSFPVLVSVAKRRKIQTELLSRKGLYLPLAHVCYESRLVVKEAGYELRFGADPSVGGTADTDARPSRLPEYQKEARPESKDNDTISPNGGDNCGARNSTDPGVWFCDGWDELDRTLWGPGDFFWVDHTQLENALGTTLSA